MYLYSTFHVVLTSIVPTMTSRRLSYGASPGTPHHSNPRREPSATASPQNTEMRLLNAISGLSRQLNDGFLQMSAELKLTQSRLQSMEDRMEALEKRVYAEDSSTTANPKKRRRVHNPKIAVRLSPNS